MAEDQQGNSTNNGNLSSNGPGEGAPGSSAAPVRSNRGFASMDRERQRQIASQGGKAAHREGTAHQFTSEEARAAGRKGGEARAAQRALGRKGPSVSSSSPSNTDGGGNRDGNP